MGYAEHKERVAHEAPHVLPCGVLTVSDTRTPDDDDSGKQIVEQLRDAKHTIVKYEIVPDDGQQIIALIEELIDAECAVVILNGGTGIGKRDGTFEAVDSLLEKRLPGFGELFRMLSYEEIGAAAMLSRATAGTYRNALLFSLPGSPHAVNLALTKLIMPELTHLVWETLRR